MYNSMAEIIPITIPMTQVRPEIISWDKMGWRPTEAVELMEARRMRGSRKYFP
jgi:hypothetical protein